MTNKQVALICAVIYALAGKLPAASVLENAAKFYEWLEYGHR